jgi:integrase
VYLSADERTALLRAAERQSSALLAFRDRAILSLLVFTGLRRSELLALRLSSVDLGEGTLRVESGKGRKSRLLPLAHQLLAAPSIARGAKWGLPYVGYPPTARECP